MRFIDETRIRITSGKGGDGCVSFRREKFVPFGGPDGGNGGKGGDVVLVASHQRSTLMELRGKALWRARSGHAGGPSKRTGASGESVEIHVPVGTRVHDADTGTVLIDLTQDGQRFVAAKGGLPGVGNAVFKSSTNRAPRKSTPGKPGEEKYLRLELLLMADVGLLGFPNAGKSTVVSRISAARPKVADYPFTTLVPSLGVVDMGVEGSFVVADVPGLIEGAADGAGLGHRFLRHVRRTRVLLHLVSLGPDEDRSPVERYSAIREELGAFDPALLDRPEILVFTKADLVDDDVVRDTIQALAQVASAHTARQAQVISAVTGQGVKELVGDLWNLLQELGPR